jgi:hypothetical protein
MFIFKSYTRIRGLIRRVEHTRSRGKRQVVLNKALTAVDEGR